jgi:HSP20 family protein
MTTPNPFRGLVDLMGEMRRMRDLGKSGYEEYEDQDRTHANPWVPAADIFARGEDLVIRLELAGLLQEAIDITFAEGMLTISGENPTEDDEADVTYWRRERPHGVFRRSIGLPEEVTSGDISAESREGLVTVTVRGACAATVSEPARIPVNRSPA